MKRWLIFLVFPALLYANDEYAKETRYNKSFIEKLQKKSLIDVVLQMPVIINDKGDITFTDGKRGTLTFLYAPLPNMGIYRDSKELSFDRENTTNLFRGFFLYKDGLYQASHIVGHVRPKKDWDIAYIRLEFYEKLYGIKNISLDVGSMKQEPLFYDKQYYKAAKLITNTRINASFIKTIKAKRLIDMESRTPVTISSNGDLLFENPEKGAYLFQYALSSKQAVYKLNDKALKAEGYIGTNIYKGLIVKRKKIFFADEKHNVDFLMPKSENNKAEMAVYQNLKFTPYNINKERVKFPFLDRR